MIFWEFHNFHKVFNINSESVEIRETGETEVMLVRKDRSTFQKMESKHQKTRGAAGKGETRNSQ